MKFVIKNPFFALYKILGLIILYKETKIMLKKLHFQMVQKVINVNGK